MLESKLSRVLMVLGASIGIVGIGVWAIELRLNLPDWMIQVAMVKLAFLGAAGLLGAGALLGRHAKRSALADTSRKALGEGSLEPFHRELRQPDAVPRSDKTE